MVQRPSEYDQVRIIVKSLTPRMHQHMFSYYINDFKHLLVIGSQVEKVVNSMPEEALRSRNFNRNEKPAGNNALRCVDLQELCLVETFPRRTRPRVFNLINVSFSKLYLFLSMYDWAIHFESYKRKGCWFLWIQNLLIYLNLSDMMPASTFCITKSQAIKPIQV